MTQSDKRDTQPSVHGVALIVGGPGVSSSCARLFAESGMRVAVASPWPDKRRDVETPRLRDEG